MPKRTPQILILDTTSPRPDIRIDFVYSPLNIAPAGVSGLAGFGAFHDDFIATANQTAFVLNRTPNEAALVFAVIDHMAFYAPVNLNVVGNTAIWLPASAFPLEAGQAVRIYYT